LHTLFTQAFAVAKRVRTETEIARHAVSVSFAAVELAKTIFAKLAGRAVLLLGAGKMSELAAKHLVEQGAFPIYVVNRTWARAQELARALSGTAVPFEELGTALAAVDIVITSTGAAAPIVTRDMVAPVVRGRGTRPLFFIDIAVPRDVEPGVDALPGVYRYDIDDLQQVVDANIRERLREAQRGEALVEREVAKFRARLGDVEVIPTIVALRERLGETRAGGVGGARARAVPSGAGGAALRRGIGPMRPEGARRPEARLAAIGGKGLFVREIEDALLRGDADVAVHSLKDLPADLPRGLTLAVFPEREDPRDVLVAREAGGLETLPRGAMVGTSSPRRRAIALSLRPDLRVAPIRGNVDTRLVKLQTGEWGAVLLAAAGLRRLGLEPRHATPLAPEVFVPAVGQGVLGVQARADAAATRSARRPVAHAD